MLAQQHTDARVGRGMESEHLEWEEGDELVGPLPQLQSGRQRRSLPPSPNRKPVRGVPSRRSPGRPGRGYSRATSLQSSVLHCNPCATEVEVLITDSFRFVPDDLHVTTEAVVKFTVSKDCESQHQITVPSCGVTSPQLMPGESWATTLSIAGSHTFASVSHSFMHGNVTVFPQQSTVATAEATLVGSESMDDASSFASSDCGSAASFTRRHKANGIPVVFVPQSAASTWDYGSVHSFDDDTRTVDSDDFVSGPSRGPMGSVLRLESTNSDEDEDMGGDWDRALVEQARIAASLEATVHAESEAFSKRWIAVEQEAADTADLDTAFQQLKARSVKATPSPRLQHPPALQLAEKTGNQAAKRKLYMPEMSPPQQSPAVRVKPGSCSSSDGVIVSPSVTPLSPRVSSADESFSPERVAMLAEFAFDPHTVTDVYDRPPTPEPVEVVIDGFTYEPRKVVVPVGGLVRWVVPRRCHEFHAVCGRDACFESPVLSAGDTYTHRFDTPGAYAFQDSIYCFMEGLVVVTPTTPWLAKAPVSSPPRSRPAEVRSTLPRAAKRTAPQVQRSPGRGVEDPDEFISLLFDRDNQLSQEAAQPRRQASRRSAGRQKDEDESKEVSSAVKVAAVKVAAEAGEPATASPAKLSRRARRRRNRKRAKAKQQGFAQPQPEAEATSAAAVQPPQPQAQVATTVPAAREAEMGEEPKQVAEAQVEATVQATPSARSSPMSQSPPAVPTSGEALRSLPAGLSGLGMVPAELQSVFESMTLDRGLPSMSPGAASDGSESDEAEWMQSARERSKHSAASTLAMQATAKKQKKRTAVKQAEPCEAPVVERPTPAPQPKATSGGKRQPVKVKVKARKSAQPRATAKAGKVKQASPVKEGKLQASAASAHTPKKSVPQSRAPANDAVGEQTTPSTPTAPAAPATPGTAAASEQPSAKSRRIRRSRSSRRRRSKRLRMRADSERSEAEAAGPGPVADAPAVKPAQAIAPDVASAGQAIAPATSAVEVKAVANADDDAGNSAAEPVAAVTAASLQAADVVGSKPPVDQSRTSGFVLMFGDVEVWCSDDDEAEQAVAAPQPPQEAGAAAPSPPPVPAAQPAPALAAEVQEMVVVEPAVGRAMGMDIMRAMGVTNHEPRFRHEFDPDFAAEFMRQRWNACVNQQGGSGNVHVVGN